MLYVSETKHALAAENPDLDTMEVRKMAISNFKKMSTEEREVCAYCQHYSQYPILDLVLLLLP